MKDDTDDVPFPELDEWGTPTSKLPNCPRCDEDELGVIHEQLMICYRCGWEERSMIVQGPNVKRLIAHKMSVDAIPKGGGIADALAFLSSPQHIVASAKAATVWVDKVIELIKSAPDNPYGDDDEAIAAEILRRIEERNSERR